MAFGSQYGGPVDPFTRFWNSTFGLPEQFLRRFVRAVSDPNVDLLGSEGLVTWDLIPLVGLATEQKHRVSDKEWVDLLNRTLGTDMSNNLGTQIGASILTDPLTFLTGGATVLARGAKGVERIGSAGVALKANTTVAQTRELAKAALVTAKGARARQIRKGIRELKGVEDAELPQIALKEHAGKRQIAVGLPFLHRFGAGKPLDSKYRSWWHFFNTVPTGLAYRFGSALIPQVVKDSPLGTIPKLLGDARAGAESAGRSVYVYGPGEVSPERGQALRWASDILDEDVPGIRTKIDEKLGGISGILDRFDVSVAPEDLSRLAEVQSELALHKVAGKILNPSRASRDELLALLAEHSPDSAVLARAQTVKVTKAEIAAELRGTLDTDTMRLSDAKAASLRAESRKLKRAKGDVGLSVNKRLARALRIRNTGGDWEDRVGHIWRVIAGKDAPLPTSAEQLRGGLESFLTRTDDATNLLIEGAEKGKLTKTGKRGREAQMAGGLRKFVFETVRAINQRRINWFVTDTGFRDMRQAGLDHKDDLARSTEAIDARAAAIERVLPLVAAELGGTVEQTRELFRAILEATPHADEARVLTANAVGNPTLFYDSVLSYLTRSMAYLDSGAVVARKMGGHRAAALGETFSSLRASARLSDEALSARVNEVVLDAAHESGPIEPLLRSPVEGKVLQYSPRGDKLRGVILGRMTTEQASRRRDELGRLMDEISSGGRRVQKGTFERMRDDYFDLEKIIEMRHSGVGPLPAPHPGSVRPPRTSVESQDFFGAVDTEKLPILARYMADLAASAHELKRVAGEAARRGDTFIPPSALLRRIEDSIAGIHHEMEGAIREGLGKMGRGVLDETRDMQAEILSGTLRAGALSPGAPIAYVPRVLSSIPYDRLRIAIGAIPMETRQKMSPEISSIHKRSLDSLTLDQIVDYSRELRRVGDPKRADGIDEVLTGAGIDVEHFVTDPFASIYNRLGAAKEHWTTVDFVDSMLSDISPKGIGEQASMTPVRVVGFNRRGSRVIHYLDSPKVKAGLETVDDEQKMVVKMESTRQLENELEALVVQHRDGSMGTILLSQLGEGRGLLDPTLASRYADIKGGKISESIAHLAARGELNDVLIRGRDQLTAQRLERLLGQEVVWGDISALDAVTSSLMRQNQTAGKFGAGYDVAHNFVKKFQTIFRPAFHVANLASGFAQSLMAGHGTGHTMGGMMDALRFLSDNPRWARKYDATIDRIGDGSGFTRKGLGLGRLEFLRGPIRRRGHDIRTTDQAVAGQRRITVLPGEEEEIFKLAGTGRSYEMSEILDAMIQENLHGSFVSEALRGQVGIPKRIGLIQEYANPKGLKQRAAAAVAAGTELGESSETFVRLMNMFAGMRAGLDPRTAAAFSAEANVRYAQVTATEKMIYKRAFSYFTFPRKFIPYAWRRFAEDPKQASIIANSLKGALGDGVAVDESGQVNLRASEDWRFKLQRSHAGVDALIGTSALFNFLVPGKAPGEDILGTGQLPAFMQIGPLVESAMGLVQERRSTDKSWAEEQLALLPQIRWFQESLGDSPAEPEKTALELAFGDVLLGQKKVRKNHEARIYKSRMDIAQQSLRRAMRDAAAQGNMVKLNDLQEELKLMADVYKRKMGITISADTLSDILPD